MSDFPPVRVLENGNAFLSMSRIDTERIVHQTKKSYICWARANVAVRDKLDKNKRWTGSKHTKHLKEELQLADTI
jgi:hypothetical protein